MKSKNDLEVLVKVKYDINIDVPKVKKNIIEESNTIEKQGNTDIINDVTMLRDAIIDNTKEELETDELANKVSMFEESISSLKTEVKIMGSGITYLNLF